MPNFCLVEGCDRTDLAGHGYCKKHYSRYYRTGDPLGVKKYNRDMEFHCKKTPEHNSWAGMKERCLNPNSRFYCNYGGRGIKVCDRWLGVYGFQHFYEDMGEKPEPKHRYSLDRIDSDGDYCPENCRWADRWTQSANRRWGKSDSQVPGVWKYNARLWCASLTVNGKEYRKYAKTEAEAIVKRKEFERLYLHQEK